MMKYIQVQTWRVASLTIIITLLLNTYTLFLTTYHSHAQTMYGYIVDCPTGELTEGPIHFQTTNTDTLFRIADQSAEENLCAGTWVNGKWYAIVFDANQLIEIDLVTGIRTILDTLIAPAYGYVCTGLSYDAYNGILYALSSSGYQSTLSIIDTTDYSLSTVGVSFKTALACLAVSSEGRLYSVDILTDIFGEIDRTTGKWAEIEHLPFDASFSQDMEFDHRTKTCYYSAFSEHGGGLWSVNLENGLLDNIGTYQYLSQISGFAIPYSSSDLTASIKDEIKDSYLKIYPNPSNGIFTISLDTRLLSGSLQQSTSPTSPQVFIC